MAVTDRLQGFNIGAAVKPACVVASTGSLTLQGAQTIDGIAVGSCERVLVKDQTTASDNGIYLADSSTWVRARDFDGSRDAIPGTFVHVTRGTQQADSFWRFNATSTATKIDIGTDDIDIDQITVSLAGVTVFSQSLLALSSSVAWKSTDGLALGSAADVNLGNSSTNVGLLESTGLRWSGIQSWNVGSDIASANTLTLGSTGNYFNITGNTNISAITSVSTGTFSKLHANSTFLLLNSTSLVTPSSTDIAVEAGDEFEVLQHTSDAWRVTNYERKSGQALVAPDSGKLLAISSTQAGGVATTTNTIPNDDTAPQNTEGAEFMDLDHTPQSTSTTLIVDVTIFGAGSASGGNNTVTTALFRDSIAGAIGAGFSHAGADLPQNIRFTTVFASPSTATITFKVRCGLAGAGTFTFNGISGGRSFNGLMQSGILIKEISA